MPRTSEEARAKGRLATKRWKDEHPEADKEHKEHWRRKSGSPVGKGHGSTRRWTQEEDRRVLEHSVPDRQLSQEIDRTLLAITVRRSKIRETPGPCGPCSGPGVLECEHTRA